MISTRAPTLAAAGALALVMALTACGRNDVEKPSIGGPFTLTSHEGARVSDADFRGQPMLIYFGFTYCPDVCPLALQKLSHALDMLSPQEAATFQPLLITVDPQRDTPEVLARYVASGGFPSNLMGLTGAEAEIAAVAEAYKVYYEAVETPDSYADYLVDHTSVIYLMDETGAFAEAFTHSSTPEEIAAGLRRRLAARAAG